MPKKEYYHKHKSNIQFEKEKKEQAKKDYKIHKELRDKKHNQYVADNKEKVYAQRKKLKKGNPKYLIHNRRYIQNNKEKVREAVKQSKQKKPNLYALHRENRRAKLKGIIHDFSSAEWLAKLQATKGVCPDCNRFVGVENLTLDHINPISRAREGQIYTINDVQPLCKICNSKKGDKEMI